MTDAAASRGLHVPDRQPARSASTTNTAADGVFGWYQYIQDFTGEFALDWLKRLAPPGGLVWEPFAGSGTTLVAAKMLGLPSVGYDTIPFMVDVARTKVSWDIPIGQLVSSLDRLLLSMDASDEPSSPVQVTWSDYDDATAGAADVYARDKKLEKWIAPKVVDRFQRLLAAINTVDNPPVRRFLRVAAATTLMRASNMTYRPNICYEPRATIDFPVIGFFAERAQQMIEDYKAVHVLPGAHASVFEGDARSDGPDEAQLVFTSPPYPNDMEYVHQTRLELSMFEYVEDQKGLTRLKKRMIASSVKLVYRDNEWQKAAGLEVPGVADVCEPIARTLAGRNWGWNAADMTAQYFGGMRTVLRNWARRLTPGGQAAVVIGDSAFNGVKVPTDTLLAATAEVEGFTCEGIEVFRSRWNTKHDIELRESVVLLTKRA